jgi:NAD-dependent SIR2 family protein deacetylase
MENESDEVYRIAAKLISNATFLIIGAGAGMSVDSGLSTYADVSNLPWFKTHDLTYRDLSNPDLLVKNPDWFYAYEIVLFSSFLFRFSLHY